MQGSLPYKQPSAYSLPPSLGVPISAISVAIASPIRAWMFCISRMQKVKTKSTSRTNLFANLVDYSGFVQWLWLLQGQWSETITLSVADKGRPQWARTSPPQKQAGYNNPGWPGCCRPPAANEYRMIQAADWRSVSIIHQVPIPPDIKAALDSLGTRGSPIPPSSGRGGGGGGRPVMPSFDRRNGGSSGPSSRSSSLSGKTSAMSISSKARGSSPKQLHASLGSSLSRSSSGNAISTSVPTSSPLEQGIQRRQTPGDFSAERRVDGTHSLHSSPSRRNVDLDASITPKRNSSGRPSVTPATPSVSLSKVVVDGRPQASIRRRASVSSSPKSSPHSQRPTGRPSSFVIPRSTKKEEDLSSASSSSGSSDGLGSMTDSTVTSDGGFTDYLSDESEAELQRQAEARAALFAQNQAEEQEFKAARQQLAHVDLRPPKSWNPTNITNSPAPRLASGPTAVYSSRSDLMVHSPQT